MELLPTVLDSFSEQRQREKALDELASKMKETASETELETAARDYLIAVMMGDQHRIAVDTAISEYINTGNSRDDTQEVVADAIDAHQALDDAIGTLSEKREKAAVTIPATLSISGPERIEFPKGVERSFEYVVTNVGDEPAESVEIEMETDLSINLTQEDVGTIGGRSETTVQITGTSTETGVEPIELTATSDDGQEALLSITAGAGSVKHYLESSLNEVRQLKSTVRERTDDNSGRKKGGKGGIGGLVAKLQRCEETLQTAIDWIEQDKNEHVIKNKIGSAINQLDAFVEQLDGLESKQIESGVVALLNYNIEQIIPRLKRAQRTEL